MNNSQKELNEINKFKFNSKNEVELFEKYLKAYSEKYAMIACPYLPLTPAFEFFIGDNKNNRAFYALFDLKISYIHLVCDSMKYGAIWNEKFSKGKFEGGSILDHFDRFEGKMAIHRYQTSYIFRYRAIWDKIMGFVILTQIPDEYDIFIGSKKKKNTFKKICISNNLLSDEIMNTIDEALIYFDDTFRTPEAHSTGTMRLWTFSMDSWVNNPQIDLIGYSNYLIKMLVIIQSFYGIEYQ